MKSRLFVALVILSWSGSAATLVLKRAFIEEFKDRATIDATFTVDHAHKKPNKPADDGDMHVAGRAPKEIGLPMVAEIMNAADTDAKVVTAIKMVHDNEGTSKSLAVSGAWRVWFEHPPSQGSQVQGATVPKAANTNPDHCFEIHPITKVAGSDLTGTFHDVKDFPGKETDKAFGAYEKLKITLSATKTAVTMDSTKTGFNYVKFTMHTTSALTKLKDGGFAVTADVLAEAGDEDEALASGVRMIFVPGTPPWKKVMSGLAIGDEMGVLGIPRVNLNAISTAINSKSGVPAGPRKLPYEMIVVGLE
jgi:hypothetical protein